MPQQQKKLSDDEYAMMEMLFQRFSHEAPGNLCFRWLEENFRTKEGETWAPEDCETLYKNLRCLYSEDMQFLAGDYKRHNKQPSRGFWLIEKYLGFAQHMVQEDMKFKKDKVYPVKFRECVKILQEKIKGK